MLSVANKSIMLSVLMLNVVILSVVMLSVAIFYCYAECFTILWWYKQNFLRKSYDHS